jgi:hypothetical protein
MKWNLKGKNIEEILDNEKTKNEDKEDIKKILMNLKIAAIYFNKNLFCFMTLKEINLVLKYRISENDINVYMDYCVFLNIFFQDYKGSYKLGSEILNKFKI